MRIMGNSGFPCLLGSERGKRENMMDERYEHFNAKTFEAYCKISIDRAVNRGRRQKHRRAQREVSLTALPDAALAFPCDAIEALIEEQKETTIFRVDDVDIPVHDKTLAMALFSLTPQRRSILLLAYFLNESDADIARDLNLTRSAVQRRRASALELMRQLMGGQTE